MRCSCRAWVARLRAPSGIGWSLLHLFVFLWLFASKLYGEQILGGDQLYFRYASRVVRGEVPYRDFTLEYPPFSLVAFALPRLFTASPFRWERGFLYQVIVWDLVVLWLLGRVKGRGNAARAAYTIGLISIGPLVTQRFDLLPGALALSALLAHAAGHHRTAWFALLLGIFTKLYPVVLLPLFVVDLACRRKWRALADGLAISAVTCVACAAVNAWLWPGMLSVFIGYHTARPVEIESLYANIGLLAHALVGAPAATTYEYGSVNLRSSLGDGAARLSLPLAAIALVACYAWYWRHARAGEAPAELLFQYACLVTLGFIVTNKVLSPQYLIWLLPLVALSRSVVVLALFAAVGCLTFGVYPLHFDALIRAEHGAICLLSLRNVLLLLLAIAITRWWGAAPCAVQFSRGALWWLRGLLVVFAACLGLVFAWPAPRDEPVHLPPDLDGDGRVGPLEAAVVAAGGIDYNEDGRVDEREREILQSRGLDVIGDGIVDAAEWRFFFRYAGELVKGSER